MMRGKLLKHLPFKAFIFSPKDSLLIIMKNAFYLTQNPRFVLEIFKFLYFCLPIFFTQSAVAFEDDRR